MKVKFQARPTRNPEFPTAWRVVDSNNEPLVAHSGLFGWGWCASREGAAILAGLSPQDAASGGTHTEAEASK